MFSPITCYLTKWESKCLYIVFHVHNSRNSIVYYLPLLYKDKYDSCLICWMMLILNQMDDSSQLLWLIWETPQTRRTLSSIVCLPFSWVSYAGIFYSIKFMLLLLSVFLQTSLFPDNYVSGIILHILLSPRART